MPLLNIDNISGLPHPTVKELRLNTESKSTGLSFHP